MLSPSSLWRVSEQTDSQELGGEPIEKQTKERIERSSSRELETIEKRIEALDREWDAEKVLEAEAAVLALAGALLSTKNRKWLFLSAAATGLLLQHVLQGWSPPLPVLRKLGFRTRGEIDEEKFAFKSLVETVGKFKGESPRAAEQVHH